MSHCTDRIGNILEVGNQITYARKNSYELHFGEVTAIFPDSNQIKVRNMKTKRISVNKRRGEDCLNISILKEVAPEFFI